ncbi:MAG TPA: SRPBCC family protein [Chitinophagaceae bacterium]|jgi:uncharacterized protein YndB with AHSA1/START domain|nr:SRPBCC family protein [Chitinophagaceae bacterium]
MEKRTVERSVIISALAPDVWKAITDPEIIKKFLLGANVDTDWKEGSPITYSGTFKEKEYRDKGKVLVFEKNKKLEHTYWSSLSGTEDIPENYFIVTYELEQRENDTVLCITQEGLMSEDSYQHSAQNWEGVLQKIKDLVEKEVVASPVIS